MVLSVTSRTSGYHESQFFVGRAKIVDLKIATGNSVTPVMEARTLAGLAPPFGKVKGALSQGRIPYPNRHLSFFRWAGLDGFVRDWLWWALAEDESHKSFSKCAGTVHPIPCG